MRFNHNYGSVFLGSLLLFICVFDPKDLLLGIKIPLFISFVVVVLVGKILKKEKLCIPIDLLLFLILFSIFIPLFSSFVYYIRNDFQFSGYQGLSFIKAYVFLFFAVFLYFIDNKLLPIFIRLLLLLSIITISLFFVTYIFPEYIDAIYKFGDKYGIFAMPRRQYGSLSFLAIYFHTAPLLIFSLGYYLYEYFQTRKVINLICFAITFLSLLFSGTRNNVFSAILMSIVFYFVFLRNKTNRQIIMIMALVSVVLFMPSIIELINSSPVSDKTKLNFAMEYIEIMRNPTTSLIGQGFGSSFFTSERGVVSLTELTYFEIFRRFGIIFGVLQIFLMFYPLFYWRTQSADKRWIIIVYIFYLIMVFFNPFYFSSNGMIILSFVLVSKYKFWS